MTTFTPTYSGPLRVEQRPDGSFAILDHNDNLFAITYSSVDARLIAASPEILAALTACLATLIERGGIDEGTPCIRMARAAIRSAKSPSL